MFNWFQKMREQPLKKRRLIAFGIALLCTGFIFVIWLAVWLPNTFYTQSVSAQNNSQFESPKDNFFQSISAAWSGIAGDVSQLKNSFSSTTLSNSVQYQATSSELNNE